MATAPADVENRLADAIAATYDDMEAYFRMAFQWGEKSGPLEDHDVPDDRQLD